MPFFRVTSRVAVVAGAVVVALEAGACPNGGEQRTEPAAGAGEPLGVTQPVERWSDAETVAYIRDVAATIMADEAVVEQLWENTALPAFVRELVARQRVLRQAADSLAVGGVQPHASGVADIRRHIDAMRRVVRQDGDFDRRYMGIIQQTLADAEARLHQSMDARRSAPVSHLIDRAAAEMRRARSSPRLR